MTYHGKFVYVGLQGFDNDFPILKQEQHSGCSNTNHQNSRNGRKQIPHTKGLKKRPNHSFFSQKCTSDVYEGQTVVS